jgi:peptidoglycan/xylan/chitin deacetylase (PgdA/CDA1 family)
VGDTTINLTFHGIGEPARDLEPGESDVWVSRDRFHSMLDAVAERADVRITFDDGNASDVEHALFALNERGLTATFFVVAGRLGSPGFLDAEGVRQLAAAGMSIGSHGMRHRAWRSLDATALHEELVDAKRVLERVVGQPVTQAACPFGSYDHRVLGALRRCAYRRVYTSDRGAARSGAWLQPRTSIRSTDDDSSLDRILADGAHRRAGLLRRVELTAKRWR